MAIKSAFLGKKYQTNKDNISKTIKNISDIDFTFDHILFPNQIHSNKVLVIDSKEKIFEDDNRPQCDAIITNLKNVAIGVVTADCAPILLWDEKNNIIAAIHAGWRGALSKIIENTIMTMKKIGAENIKAEIGPMIQQDSYEVSQDLLDKFCHDDSQNNKFFIKSKIVDKFQFNLNGFIKNSLIESGLNDIKNSKLDTFTEEEKYYSYRRYIKRNKLEEYGRNISIICIN